MAGSPLTVIVVELEQPLLFRYVTVAVPVETPVMTPAAEIDTTAEFEDDQALIDAGRPDPVNVAV